MKIFNSSRSLTLADKAEKAQSFFSRLQGLIGKDSLQDGEALIIPGCRSVHTFFMRFPIDVLFVNRDNRVVAYRKNLKPFLFSPYFIKSNFVIELPSGVVEKSSTAVGDVLSIED